MKNKLVKSLVSFVLCAMVYSLITVLVAVITVVAPIAGIYSSFHYAVKSYRTGEWIWDITKQEEKEDNAQAEFPL